MVAEVAKYKVKLEFELTWEDEDFDLSEVLKELAPEHKRLVSRLRKDEVIAVAVDQGFLPADVPSHLITIHRVVANGERQRPYKL